MPRIYTSCSDPLDFCRECFPSEDEAEDAYGNLGDGQDGRGNCFGYNEDHPDYEDTDYRCETCKTPLTAKDN
ncbi:hypothetical protein ACRQ5Q_14735 [Bradyrhizobium sp. PMVTL-01]|uniref:hypothetical protein n=1 Tax=Bradyrhizobium sp. PMVTL-01 TaxID=3434999 RepID=UPI003F70CCA9